MHSHIIVGLDVGTATVKAAVVEYRSDTFLVRAVLKEPSVGVRRGAIVDLADASGAISRILSEVKKIAKSALRKVYVNIGTPQSKAQPSQGTVIVSRADNEIYEDDRERVTKTASQSVALGPNRIIAHTVTREFIIDGVGDIQDPIGLSGNKLEIKCLVVDAFAPHVRSLVRAIELGGAQVGGMIYSPLAAARATLTKNQKDLGVLLIDMGAGTTGIAVYEENKLVDAAIFPVGGGHVTNDIAVGLKIPVDAAERIKLHYGFAEAKEVHLRETIDLSKFSSEHHGNVSRRHVAEIIEARLAEIMEFVDNRVKTLGKQVQLPGGLVFVGGGAKIPGLTELARQELRLSSQIGVIGGDGKFRIEEAKRDAFEDPEYATLFGLVLWGAEKEGWKANAKTPLFDLRGIIRRFIP